MKYILLIGAALNLIGGTGILFSMWIKLPFTFPILPSAKEINPPDYVLYRLFTVGTAFVFGSMYIYLYHHSEYAMPFLIFGMALKYWAFLASLFAYLLFKMPKDIMINFGFTNLVVAILFSYFLYNT